MTEEIMRALGRIEGQIDGLKTTVTSIDAKQDKIDNRLRKVEVRGAINGAVTGSIMGVGVSLLVSGLTETIKRGGIS